MLDVTDRKIVSLLQQNARISNKDLAQAAGIAASTCSERVQRLNDAGIFRGFHADVDPALLGLDLQALVSCRLRRHSAAEVDKFIRPYP